MFCTKCGKEISADIKFCKYCGAPNKFAQTASQPQVNNGPQAPQQTYTPNNQQAYTPNRPQAPQQPYGRKGQPVSQQQYYGQSRQPIPQQQYQNSGSSQKPGKKASGAAKVLAIICIVFAVVIIGLTVAYFVSDYFKNDVDVRTKKDNESSSVNEHTDEGSYKSDEEVLADLADKLGENSSKEEQVIEETIKPTETPEPEEEEEYILPDSDSKYLQMSDLEGMTADECRLARNEIYARHGRKFKDEALQAYFESFDWYEPTIEADDFREDMLNDYESANRDLIIEYETKQGYR